MSIAFTYAFMTPFVWSDQSEMGGRDETLAEKNMTRLSELEGYDGAPFRIVGHTDYPALAWGDMIGWIVFMPEILVLTSIKDMHDLDWYADGRLYEGSKAPAFPATSCALTATNPKSVVSASRQKQFCGSRKSALPPFEGGIIDVVNTARQTARSAFHDVQSRGHTVHGGYFYTAGWSGEVPDAIEVSMIGGDGAVTWSEKLTLGPTRYPFDSAE